MKKITSLVVFNSELHKVYPFVSLYKGQGYFYFISDNNDVTEPDSIYINSFVQGSNEMWAS